MKLVQCLSIGILLVLGGIAEAMSKKSALSSELLNLGRYIQFYHDQEGGYPRSWNELEKVTPDLDRTFSILKPTQRMVLMSPPFGLPENYAKGHILAMTREAYQPKSWTQWPFIGITREYLQDPAYGVILTEDGGVFLRHMPPKVIKNILKEAGLPMPKPSGLGRFTYEKEYLKQRIFNWTVAVAVGFWFIWGVIQRRKTQRSEVVIPK